MLVDANTVITLVTNTLWLRDLLFSLICQYKNFGKIYSQVIYLLFIWKWDSIQPLKRFRLTVPFPVCSRILIIQKKETHFWHSKGFKCSTVASHNTLVSRFVFFLSCVRILMEKWKLYYGTYYHKHTFVTCIAFILPVCRTWGPRHKSIRGPHLQEQEVTVISLISPIQDTCLLL